MSTRVINTRPQAHSQKTKRGRGYKVKLALAFAAIYLVYGSTYLAIRYSVETIPPLVTAGIRLLVAGCILFVWAWTNGFRPRRDHWIAGSIVGALFFLISHGLLYWAEKTVTSGVAALVIAIEPMFILILGWVAGQKKMSWLSALGLGVGAREWFRAFTPNPCQHAALHDHGEPTGCLYPVPSPMAQPSSPEERFGVLIYPTTVRYQWDRLFAANGSLLLPQPADLLAPLTDPTLLALCRLGLLLRSFRQERSLSPPSGMATVATGQVLLAGLSPAGLTASFAAPSELPVMRPGLGNLELRRWDCSMSASAICTR